ncbi:hypothetical protein FQA39_LY12862 [Lamprigera yunnana]|nr:hypothetical protein FQA39_LY12862 [Lamprigera yunnana]
MIGQVVLKGISFNVHEGECITLLGPSGCGKTTTLKIIGGIEKPNAGDVLFEGKDLLPISMDKRPFNTIFQSYALFPNRDVFGNIAFGLEQKRVKREVIEKEVAKQIKQIGLEGFETKKPDELSETQEEIGITFIMVSHDQEEALSMSDRVVVMNNGTIQQIGTPEEIYNEPENA